MSNHYIATSSIHIHSNASQVWNALTQPDMIKQYFYGVDVISDWKEGDTILYRGTWEGQTFEDKGNILKLIPGKLMITNYWTSYSGLPDMPENYQNVTYALSEDGDGVLLTVTQDNIPSEESKNHSEQNWQGVLVNLKSLLEKPQDTILS